MMIKVVPVGHSAPQSYTISGEVVNGVDISSFPEGGKMVDADLFRTAGIRDIKREEGVLYVTLIANCASYDTLDGADSDWVESSWMDAAEYDPSVCYPTPTNVDPVAELVFIDGCWTALVPSAVESDEELPT